MSKWTPMTATSHLLFLLGLGGPAHIFRIKTERSSKVSRPEDRRQFVEEMERLLGEWGRKVERFTEHA